MTLTDFTKDSLERERRELKERLKDPSCKWKARHISRLNQIEKIIGVR